MRGSSVKDGRSGGYGPSRFRGRFRLCSADRRFGLISQLRNGNADYAAAVLARDFLTGVLGVNLITLLALTALHVSQHLHLPREL